MSPFHTYLIRLIQRIVRTTPVALPKPNDGPQYPAPPPSADAVEALTHPFLLQHRTSSPSNSLKEGQLLPYHIDD